MSISFKTEQTDAGSICISIEGDLTIQHASDLKSCLLEAMEKSQSVRVDLSGANQETDASCLQLLCSAHKYAIGKGKGFCLDRVPRHVKAALDLAGFSRPRGCVMDANGSCLWMERRYL